MATITAFPKTGPQDQATTDTLNRLRDDVLPPAERATGATVEVGGLTASQEDFTRVVASKLPVFIGAVVILSALLLLAVFRSVFIPLKAAVMNLLSIGAALGVVTAIFQNGVGAGALGIGTGPIESFVPVMVFAIVFGLSMDYEIFLISRVHEEWERTGDASRAVGRGLATTGKVITAAASIMVVVFASFALGDDRIIKLFGLGLASAILLDALVIRCLLVPALMELVRAPGLVAAGLAGPRDAAPGPRAPARGRRRRTRSTSACPRRSEPQRRPACATLGPQPDRQRLELADERRLGRTPGGRRAPSRGSAAASPRTGSAAPAARAPCRGRSAGRRRRTPGARRCARTSKRSGSSKRDSSRLEETYQMHDLLALADRSARRARRRASRCGGSARRRGTSAATPRPRRGSAPGRRAAARRWSGCSISARIPLQYVALVESLPAAIEQEEAHDDLVLLEPLAVELGVDEHAGEVVGRALAALGDQPRAALEDLRDVALHDGLDALGVEVGVAGAERRVHQPRPDRVVLGRDAHEAADHARDDRLGDVGDEVARLAARRGGRARRP